MSLCYIPCPRRRRTPLPPKVRISHSRTTPDVTTNCGVISRATWSMFKGACIRDLRKASCPWLAPLNHVSASRVPNAVIVGWTSGRPPCQGPRRGKQPQWTQYDTTQRRREHQEVNHMKRPQATMKHAKMDWVDIKRSGDLLSISLLPDPDDAMAPPKQRPPSLPSPFRNTKTFYANVNAIARWSFRLLVLWCHEVPFSCVVQGYGTVMSLYSRRLFF